MKTFGDMMESMETTDNDVVEIDIPDKPAFDSNGVPFKVGNRAERRKYKKARDKRLKAIKRI